MHVDFMPKTHIEAAELKLLAEYGQAFSEITAPPVPVEEIVECHLKLDFDFDDLVDKFGSPDVLGASWIDEKRVVIDTSLDPCEYPPDMPAKTTDLVLEQAEVLCKDWSEGDND